MEVRFPDDAPMYEVLCGRCPGPTHAGGFLVDGETRETALEDHRKYGVCGSCGGSFREIGCTLRVFDTPDELRGKKFEAQDPFEEPK